MVIILLVILGAGAYLWLSSTPEPMPETASSLESGESVTVETDPWLTFTPAETSSTAFIFYPGGLVPVEAYAPSLRAIAEAGYLVVGVPMPFGLAVLSPDAADAVVEAYPDVERWVIGGHSLGGAMAASYTASHDVHGLALWAAYPAADVDLSDVDVEVASIYASDDGLATIDKIEDSKSRLPADTVCTEIIGGNHAQFGWYGPQDGDGEATVTREDQQEQVVAATLQLIETVEAE